MIVQLKRSGELNNLYGVTSDEDQSILVIIYGNISGLISDELRIKKISNQEATQIIKDSILNKNKSTDMAVFSKFIGEFSIVVIVDNFFKFFVTDMSCYSELYLHYSKEYISLSDDFWELASVIDEDLTIDKDQQIFLKNRRCEFKKSYFKEIERSCPGSIHFLKKGKIHSKTFYTTFPHHIDANYLNFCKLFEEVVKFHINSNNILAYSGGIDSTAILASLMKFEDLDLTLSTIKYGSPFNNSKRNFEALMGENIGEFLGVNYEVNDFNFNSKSNILNLPRVIKEMPFSPHLTLNYEPIFKNIDSLSCKNLSVWTGQNADAIINLGNSSAIQINEPKSYLNWVGRCFLIKEYQNKFKKDGAVIFPRLIDSILKIINQNISSQYYPPESENSYLLNIISSDFKYPYSLNNSYDDESKSIMASINYSNIKDALIQAKILTYLCGGDSKCWLTLNNISNTSNVMPFSNPLMIHFFRNYSLNFSDMFFAKKFLYKYVKDNFKDFFKIKNITQKKILKNDIVGDSWDSALFFNNDVIDIRKYDGNNYNELIGKSWFNFIIDEVKSSGIKVNEE